MKAPITIGSPVQYIDGMGNIRPAILVDVSVDQQAGRRANLIVFDRQAATIIRLETGILELEPDATVLRPDRWRALPLPPAPVAEFPVQQFIELVKPLIEEAARMRVEEMLAEQSPPFESHRSS